MTPGFRVPIYLTRIPEPHFSFLNDRTDINEVVKLVQEGRTLADIAECQPATFIRYHRGIREYRNALTKPRSGDVVPKILIYWGESGTGKTYSATQEYPGAYFVTRPNKDGQVWWDNYDGQEVILFDEFYGWIPYDMLLRLCDRTPFQGAIKGGFVQIQATTFIFTSNKPWEDWYSAELKEKTDDFTAFRRRLREWGTVRHFKKLRPRDDTDLDADKRQRLMERMAPQGEEEAQLGFA